jgi:hypothetical protein
LGDSGAHGAGGIAKGGILAEGGAAENTDRNFAHFAAGFVHYVCGVARGRASF